MRFYAPIAKVDDEQRMVFGYASTAAEDGDGETITIGALEGAFDDYMRFANLREMHQLSAVGKVKEAAIDDKGMYVGAKVVDDDAWEKVKEGVYSGFSIGGKATARDPVNRKIITGLRLSEISLVDRPCNPEAVFDCWKAADAAASPEGDTSLLKDTDAALVAAFVNGEEIPAPTPAELAKAVAGAVGDPVDGKEVSPPVDGAPVEVIMPGSSGETTIEKPVDGAKVNPPMAEVPVVVPGNSGETTIEKPVDGERPAAMIPSGNGDPVQVVNPMGEKVDIDLDLTKADEAGEDDPIVKRKFTAASRREAAKSGAAMKDGSFPIENKEDLKNAISALGRAKDPAAAKAHIKRRAKALNLESELPDDWKASAKKADEAGDVVKAERPVLAQVWTCHDPSHNHIVKTEAARCVAEHDALAKATAAAKPAASAVDQLRAVAGAALAATGKDGDAVAKAGKPVEDDVQKGLYTLSELGYMLMNLRSMICGVDWEEAGEGDTNSPLPQLARDALVSLVAFFRAMSAEETEELMNSVATNTAVVDNAATFLYLAAHHGDIAKAGARHSKADMERLQKAHDLIKSLGAECEMADGDDDNANKVQKALFERDAEITELNKVMAQIEPLTKTLGAALDDLKKRAADQDAKISEQADKITKLEAQPMPPKTAANGAVALLAVTKVGDGGTGGIMDDDALVEKVGKMTDEERTLLLVKAAHRNPSPVHFVRAQATE